jgi:hypothetical protein
MFTSAIGSGPDGLSMLLYLLPSSLFILKIYYCLLHLCFGLEPMLFLVTDIAYNWIYLP